MADKALTYDSSSIQVLSGLDGIRGNPTMYVGSTDEHGLFLILRELMDNAVDEFLAKRANELRASLPTLKQLKDGSGGFWVHDNGQGVPQGTKTMVVHVNGKDVNSKMPTMQAIFGTMHASGKHSSAYANSIGTHGIGAKGTNALSAVFKVWTLFQGSWYHIEFKKGKLVSDGVVKARPPKCPFGKIESGTLIYFEPDSTMFSKKNFPTSMAENWAQMTAYMNPRFRITIDHDGKSTVFYSKNGPKDYLADRLQKLKATQVSSAMFESQEADHDVVVAFTDYDASDLRGFTNGLYNEEGGTHVGSVQDALFKTVKEYAKKKQEFTAYDFREGLVGVVNAKLSGAKFSSQAKVKLVDERMGEEFGQRMVKLATKFWASNKALAARICERSAKLNELKNSFKLSKQAATALNRVRKNGLPAKYAAFDSRTKVHDRELFLVEGDSAAGSLKEARLPFQAVLPLRGKVMNALKDAKGKTLESEEIINILAAIGYDAKASDPYAKLTVGKIICLADPDPDGPFIAGTQISVRYGADQEPVLVPIDELAASDRPFQVKSWNGHAIVWADASAGLVKTTSVIATVEVDGEKYRCDLNHKWAIRNYKPWEVTEGKVTVDKHGVAWKKTSLLTSGDWIYRPVPPGAHRKTKDYGIISKRKVLDLKEPVAVYCLTVPSYGNFLTPAGHVSANCHINSLLLTLFYKYLPDLFKMGLVYVLAAPEFYSIYKNFLVIGDTLSEVQEKLKDRGAPNNPVHHLKGHGEASSALMRVYAVNPETRKLIKINPISDQDREDFVRVMNEDVEHRKRMLNLPGAQAETKE